MKVFACVVILGLVGFCASAAAAGDSSKDTEGSELLPGVALKDGQGAFDLLNVAFQPGELKEAARTFEEARGKIKKLAGPILAGIGIKILGVVALLGGGLTLLVTKAFVVAKLAFILAAILGLQKLLSGGGGIGGGLGGLGGKFGGQGWSGSSGGWSSGGASAAYPYARAIEIIGDEAANLAYSAQKPS